MKRDKGKLSKLFLTGFFMLLLYGPLSQAQTATVNWTNVHQVIDGFGVSDENAGGTGIGLPSSLQTLFFNTTPPNFGLSLLRVFITDGSTQNPGSCLTVSSSCAGAYVSDMQAIVSNGGRLYADGDTAPAQYKANDSLGCTTGNGEGYLLTADYGLYATWQANFIRSVIEYAGVPVYSMSIQGEPDTCLAGNSMEWTAATLATYIESNLGPTFATDGISTLIFFPESGTYGDVGGTYIGVANWGTTCMTNSACYQYVGGNNWHDYDATYAIPDTVNKTPNPWSSLGKKYWMTEVEDVYPTTAGNAQAPPGCTSGTSWVCLTSVSQLMEVAAWIDDRIAVENANAYFWWCANGSSCLTWSTQSPSIAITGYVLGQYSDFVRPGYYRIDATHVPQTGVSVSAYNNASTGKLAIVATNYTASAISQTFTLTNAPTFATLTPYITSATQRIAAQTTVALTSNSFTYSLPAQSITSFVGNTTTASAGPATPTGLTASVR